jgi:hypothetical protein
MENREEERNMTDTATTIRKAETRDLEPLTELMRQYIVDFYQSPMPPIERVHGLIRMCLERREGQQFVAERKGELVGFATMYFTYSAQRFYEKMGGQKGDWLAYSL